MVTSTRGACRCSGERRMLDVIFGGEVFFRTFLAERPRGFSSVLSTGIHLGEFFLGREVFFRTLCKDSLG